jgi:hypothetical protein
MVTNIYWLNMYGVIEYNQEGKPKCEICNKHFDRVISHVRQKHNMSALDYKLKFGFDTSKGICSEKSAKLSREKAYQNYEKVIAENLINKGSSTRFKMGCKGRTKEQLSEQTIIRLSKQFKTKSIK